MKAEFLPGNAIALLETGGVYFPALLAAIDGAQQEFLLETYIFEADATGREVAAAQLTMRPKTLVEPEADAAIKVIRLVEKLEDLDDVQEVFTNVDISDDVLAAAM